MIASRRATCFAWFSLAAVGCHQAVVESSAPSAVIRACISGRETPLTGTPAAGAPAANASQAVAATHTLIVGNAESLTAWALDGSEHHTISAGPARHPRRIDATSVLALSGDSDNLSLGAQLVRISLRDGSRTVASELPPFACANATPEDAETFGLDIEEGSDFVLDAQGKAACLTLQDRNSNMVSLQVRVRVELDSGRSQRWLTLGEPACDAPAGVRTGEPDASQWCTRPRPQPDTAAPNFPFDFDDETGWLKKLGEKSETLARLRDYTLELVSPSGRWLVLGGDIQEGDYMHRSLVLCDREDGALYPVLEQPGVWPAPLKAAKRGKNVTVPAVGMADVVGESDLRWLSFTGAEDVLIVDQLVVRPKLSTWAFEGELAH